MSIVWASNLALKHIKLSGNTSDIWRPTSIQSNSLFSSSRNRAWETLFVVSWVAWSTFYALSQTMSLFDLKFRMVFSSILYSRAILRTKGGLGKQCYDFHTLTINQTWAFTLSLSTTLQAHFWNEMAALKLQNHTTLIKTLISLSPHWICQM